MQRIPRVILGGLVPVLTVTLLTAPSAEAIRATGLTSPSGSTVPRIAIRSPWDAQRGSIDTVLAYRIMGAADQATAVEGSDLLGTLPGLRTDDGSQLKGIYGWVACSDAVGGRLPDDACTVVQPNPQGAVRVNRNILIPEGGAWRSADAGGTLFNVTNTLRLTPDMVGRYVSLATFVTTFTELELLANYSANAPGVLVLPANPTLQTRPAVVAATAGGEWRATPARFSGAPAGTRQTSSVYSVWVCQNPAAATDTSLLWDRNNGCSRLTPDTPMGAQLQVSGTLPSDAGGKVVVINTSLTATPTASPAAPGGFSWVSRSAAWPVRATGSGPVAPSASASASPEVSAQADVGAVPNPSGASTPAGGPGTVAAAAATAAAAAAAGAGVDLAVAPLASTAGGGTGASARLGLALAASERVNRGRFITMKAIVSPKASAGRIRLALVRFNAKGQPISTKAIYAPVKKGVATKRWRIPTGFTPADFTLVATFEPKKKGSPGITATAPVRIT